jgi:hypothetical protein
VTRHPRHEIEQPPENATPQERVVYWAREYRKESRLLNARLYTARDELFKAVDALDA